jgi:hypothetical protein
MSNNERVRDLYLKALEKSLSKVDVHSVTYLSMKYARFLAFKCNDVLYLSQLNLLKHLEGLG